jgi:hypothetical protein
LRLVLRSLPLLLAVLAVFIHLSAGGPNRANDDFAQGAYRPLMRAERSLNEGKVDLAVRDFQLAAMRAIRFGREDVFNRIRLRLGSAGRGTGEKEFTAGWPLLSRYALWSDNFDRDSRRVERWALSSGRGPAEYRYPIILENGRTIWGNEAEWVSLWLPARYVPREMAGLLKGYRPEDAGTLVPGIRTRINVFGMGWRRCTGGVDTSLDLSPGASRSFRWYLRLGGVIRWKEPLTSGDKAGDPAANKPEDWSLASVIAIGDGTPRGERLDLVHTYRALD